MFKLALDLGKSVEEVYQMSSVEVRGWVEYFTYIAKEQKKAQKASGTRRR